VRDMTAPDIAAVVILYRPDDSMVDNIAAVAPQVGCVIAVDNTEAPEPGFLARLSDLPCVEYLPMEGNRGIAAALNAGIARAKADGFPFVLTLDQDSTPGPDMVAALLTCTSSCPDAALVSATHVERGAAETPVVVEPGCRPVLTTMTSGNLLRIDAWERVGGFDETLFIDSVDHDFCLKLHEAGLGVYECGAAFLAHSVGATAATSGPLRAHPSHHSALRRYYITRNRLAVGDRHRERFPEFRAQQRRAMWRELAKIVLFEGDKAAKARMMWRGWRDYRAGVTGAFRG